MEEGRKMKTTKTANDTITKSITKPRFITDDPDNKIVLYRRINAILACVDHFKIEAKKCNFNSNGFCGHVHNPSVFCNWGICPANMEEA